MFEHPEHIKKLKPYVPGKPIEEVQKEFGLDRIVKLASNENPIGMSPRAAQAIIASLRDINRYPNIGAISLREKISKKFGVPVKNIAVGSGSEGLMSVALRTLTRPGDEAITADGTFIGFYVTANATNIEMKLAPLKNYRYDLPAMADMIDDKTKIIYIANPNNPTGTIITKKEFDEFRQYVLDKKPDALIILDEAYYEFARENPDYPDSLDYRCDNIMTLRTFSKAYGIAGARIGYGFAEENFVTNIFKVKLPFEPSIPALAAGEAALDDEFFLNYYLDMNLRGKAEFYKLFDELGLEYVKSDANFIMIAFDGAEKAAEISEKLMRQGVIVRPLGAFKLPHCVRVTIGTPDENEYFADKLRKIL